MSAFRHLRPLLVALVVLPLSLLGQPASATTVSKAQGTPTTVSARGTTAGSARVSRVRSALRVAMRQRGDLYQYGAAGPNRFDCSGLVYFSTHRAGFRRVPRTSSQQSRFMRHIRRSAMRRGDFVFFHDGGGVYHVGIYAGRSHGRRMVLHAPRTGERVHIDPIWTNSWSAGTLRGR